jgi:hypothetical protein
MNASNDNKMIKGSSLEVSEGSGGERVTLFDREIDVQQLRETIINLMRVETSEGLDRSPFALALFAMDDIIEMVNLERSAEESEALEWLSENFAHARNGLLKLMREHPLGRPEREIAVPLGQEHLTIPAMEQFYERMDSEPLDPEEKIALVEMKVLLECAESVIRFSCINRMGGVNGISLLHGSLSDFCMSWDQSSKQVAEGLCTLFPHLKDLIKSALEISKKRPMISSNTMTVLPEEPFQRLIEFHKAQVHDIQ